MLHGVVIVLLAVAASPATDSSESTKLKRLSPATATPDSESSASRHVNGSIYKLTFSSDGSRLAEIRYGMPGVRVWDVARQSLLFETDPAKVEILHPTDVEFAPSGEWMAVLEASRPRLSGMSGAIWLFDRDFSHPPRKVSPPKYSKFNCMDVIDDETIASADFMDYFLVDVVSASVLTTVGDDLRLRGHVDIPHQGIFMVVGALLTESSALAVKIGPNKKFASVWDEQYAEWFTSTGHWIDHGKWRRLPRVEVSVLFLSTGLVTFLFVVILFFLRRLAAIPLWSIAIATLVMAIASYIIILIGFVGNDTADKPPKVPYFRSPLTYSTDGSLAAAWLGGDSIGLLDVSPSRGRWVIGEPVLRELEGVSRPDAMAISPDSRYIARVRRDGRLFVNHLQDGKPLHEEQTPIADATFVDFSPIEPLLAIGARNGELVLWSLPPLPRNSPPFDPRDLE